MAWTEEDPRTPGFYWVRSRADGERIVVALDKGMGGTLNWTLPGNDAVVSFEELIKVWEVWDSPLTPPD